MYHSGQTDEQSVTELVSALAPICVEMFQSSTNTVANLAKLKEQTSYKRTGYIEEGGSAILVYSSDLAGDATENSKRPIEITDARLSFDPGYLI